MSNSKNVKDLLAAIQRKAPTAESAPAVAPAEPAAVPPPAVGATRRPRGRVGKPVQFWMHEEDRRLLRELSAWLAGQGIRASDSLVIRTALRIAKPGPDLLRSCREASQLDGRLKSTDPSSSAA